MADITVIGGLIFADLVNLAIPDECTALISWYARMNDRQSVLDRIKISEPKDLMA